MAWETRKRGGRYYTRSRRVNGRVVREYVGTGPVAELEALLDEEEREGRLARRRAWQQQCGEATHVLDVLTVLDTTSRQVVADTLSDEGFHLHKGQWRRRRKYAKQD